MPVHNSDIAERFNKVADLLEIKGDNPFRIRAYRNIARVIEDSSHNIADMVKEGEDLSALPGVGKDLAGKITEIVRTGRLSVLEELERGVPRDLAALMKIAGLGGRRINTLHKRLGVRSLADLKRAAARKKIRELPGFGEKTERSILEGIGRYEGSAADIRIDVAEQIGPPLAEYLAKTPGAGTVIIAGSYRRHKEIVHDLDILATCETPERLMERFTAYDDVRQVLARGETKTTVLLASGIQVDLRVIPEESYGAALHYFTGSKAHNVAVRGMAVRKGLKINEYGVFRGRKRLAGRTEEEVYAQVGLPYIEPELRENRGELEAAKEKKLPRLVTLGDIRGDLHLHTTLTDGRNTLSEMIEAAQARGYEYIAVTEHSKRVTVARGLNERALASRLREIERVQKRYRGITILRSIELDILEDGSLDLPDGILGELDLTVCSVHSKFNLTRERQTERIIRAMDNPHFTVLAHPTGRMLGERPPYDVDMERLIEAAKERGCFLEINSHPVRLDLDDVFCKRAKEQGVKVAVSTDAHSIANLDNMRFGVNQARRGWLSAADIINTRPLTELRKFIRR